ncbi:MAG: MoxR family ATPase [Deltaproteobacteria bacterium]|jgi:MoxR-like ATPase|nr:MoxR family ATPase [Deltaproteobacteria bacterium]MBT4526347.1 MoxR family ATPase [Deltaproteobacteria bacterium]
MKPEEAVKRIVDNFTALRNELGKVIVGQEDMLQKLYIAILCGGHVLIEGVPGLGKTLVIKTLSEVMNLDYSRIQFTPDLMPADILGTNIVNEDENGKRFFEFYKGPIFGQMILADEINRATPKTQSALLEAMQEQRITIFGKEYQLESPFMVLATQNPFEMEGTYPLPEAQIDRFFFKLKIDYPTPNQMLEIIDKTTEDYQPELNKVITAAEIIEMRQLIRQIPISTKVKEFAVRIVMGSHPIERCPISRTRKYVSFGASPRGAQTLIMASKVLAIINGRYNPSLDDIREMAKPTLRHRIILNLRGQAEGVEVDEIIEDIIYGVAEEVQK